MRARGLREISAPTWSQVLRQGVDAIGQTEVVASISNDDLARFHDRWQALVGKACGGDAEVRLSPEPAALRKGP